MLPDNQNTLLVLFFVSVIFSILVLIIICGEYFFNFETRRLRAQGEEWRLAIESSRAGKKADSGKPSDLVFEVVLEALREGGNKQ